MNETKVPFANSFKTFYRVIHAPILFLLLATYNMVALLEIQNTSASYLPIGLQIAFAVGLMILLVIVTHLLGPKRKTSDKLQNFTSGIASHGDARQPMAIKYFLTAILFVLFDVEVIFFYPYAVNFRELGWNGLYAVLMFVGFFMAGFIYIIKRGALKWED